MASAAHIFVAPHGVRRPEAAKANDGKGRERQSERGLGFGGWCD